MNFTKDYATDESLKIIGALALVCKERGGPLTASLYEMWINGKFREIIDFKFDYTADFSKDDFLYARQIQGFLAKQGFIDLGVDKEKVAFDSFLFSEEKCRLTNIRLNSTSPNRDVSAVLHYATHKIVKILGDVPSFDQFNFSFGPGATTSVKRARSNPRVKLEAPFTCNTNMIPIVRELLNEVPVWTQSKISEGNLRIECVPSKLVFVPKNSKTYRSIGIEPTLTGFFQQGVGKYLKKRLKRFGIDLSDQSRNKRLACRSSIDGSLATIDLSNASDTISSECVWQLIPYDWCVLFDHLRSDEIQYQDKIFKLSKFSSMGNSYTFELESLIFYTVAEACCTHLSISTEDVSAYGDDIILPSQAASLLKEVLDYLGFSINLEKSFLSGPFRESCGGDFLHGFDIRPFYLKDQISVRLLFTMHNWFIRHGEYQLAKTVLSFVPQFFRIFGPDGYGDGHLIGSYRLRLNRDMRRRGYSGGFFDSYTSVKMKIFLPDNRDFVYPVYSIYVSGEQDVLRQFSHTSGSPPDHDVIPGVRSYQKISIYTHSSRIFQRAVEEI